MPKIQINLDEASKTYLENVYRKRGYPLGKNRRGYKKWTKQFLIHALKELAS